MRILLFLGCLTLTTFGQTGAVQFDNGATYDLLDHTTHVTEKQNLLLNLRSLGRLEPGVLHIGFDANAIANTQETNREAKFGYLMRHPTANNQAGFSASELVLHNANIQLYGAVNEWATIYGQVLYNPEQSFGAGTLTDLNRNQLSLRRGYLLLGNQEKTPFYASIGKMTTPFGLMDTVSPFTGSTTWHAFAGLAYGATVGYEDDNGIQLRFMGIQGGAQFRSANSGDDTPDDVANYAASAAYTYTHSDEIQLRVGLSYIDGSPYCQDWPVKHFESCDGFKNPAYDVHAVLDAGPVKLIAEFAETTKDWPGTVNPNPPLDQFEAANVSSLTLGAKVDITVPGLKDTLGVSVEYSDFEAGAEGSPWERQEQFVVGLETRFSDTMKVFAEYIHTEGYVPLNFLSGPDPAQPDNPASTHSDADAKSDVFLIGLRIAL